MVTGPYDLEETLHFEISLLKLAAGTKEDSGPPALGHDARELEQLAERMPVKRARRVV